MRIQNLLAVVNVTVYTHCEKIELTEIQTTLQVNYGIKHIILCIN